MELGSMSAIAHEWWSNAKSPVGVRRILQHPQHVFEPLKTMCPSHDTDHAIRLREETEPFSVRPYRYTHFQKDKIERLVKEMLTAKII